MASVTSHATNGVSIGIAHTVTAQDETDGYIEVDFGIDVELVPVVQVIDASGVIVDTSDAVITQPSNGVIRVADGAVTAAKATGFGKIAQVVQTVKTDTFSSSSTTFTDITGMSVSITPSATTSKVLIMCHLGILGTTGNGTSAAIKLLRGTTDIGNGTAESNRLAGIYRTAGGQNSDHVNGASFQFLDSPSTTSATTYKIQGQSQTSYSFTVNKSGADTDSALSYGTRTSSTITAIEVLA